MASMPQNIATRIEDLLREELQELGINPEALPPHEITAHMRCEVHPDKSMVYMWKEQPILRIVPEDTGDGHTTWRMFTRDDTAAMPGKLLPQ